MPAGCDCTCLFQQISISNCPLFLPCAVLPHCSVSFIFPTSLVESASLFSFPSFLRPFPHNIISLKPWLSISVSWHCFHWDTEQKTLSDNRCWTSSGAFVLSFPGPAALRCSESGHCARGDVGILGEGGQGEYRVMSMGAMKKCFVVFAVPHHSQS